MTDTRQRTAREAIARGVLGALAFAFAVTGVGFLVFPEAVLEGIERVGRSIGPFPSAPGGRFWLILAFAYMILVTFLAGLSAWRPSTFRPMLWALMAGKLASSLTALAFFMLDHPAFIYLLNFLVDGGIVLLVGLCAWFLRGQPDADGNSGSSAPPR
ncbi:hypothetical protein HRbin22_00682 [Candidatus Thermoflexus japonica]|uniref:Uncharacterized protein n=1 Tax=Candidatus Thermoflexus japonica TaxID=2035417 RepID=A0A2H5Y4W4_9CHLR|nr:hypothetical protein HRbin22_00682 [Candidatus Thermoflexus japonica]